MELKKRYTLIGVLSSYLSNYPGGKQFILFHDNVLSPHTCRNIFIFTQRMYNLQRAFTRQNVLKLHFESLGCFLR